MPCQQPTNPPLLPLQESRPALKVDRRPGTHTIMLLDRGPREYQQRWRQMCGQNSQGSALSVSATQPVLPPMT